MLLKSGVGEDSGETLGLQPARLLGPWESPGKNTRVGSFSFLQGNFSTQALNSGLLHCRQILYQLSHKGSPRIPPEFAQTHVIESVMPSNHLIHCHPCLLLPSIFPSIRVFPNESVLYIRWPKYWSLHFNISPSNEYSGLISFRMDWLDLLAVQGTLKSLL